MEDIVDLTIDTANHIPIYRQIMDRIARDIARGILPPGYQKVLEDITAELNWAMSMTGSPDLAHIDPSVIWT
jgi:hypothetical protein